MKVRVSFTVEVDAEKWACEYGVERSDVRADVIRYTSDAITTHIAELGLEVERP